MLESESGLKSDGQANANSLHKDGLGNSCSGNTSTKRYV